MDRSNLSTIGVSTQQQSGFTLIEIMVVVIVIAVVSVTVATSFGQSTDRRAKSESRRFTAVVNEVRDEAVIAGDNYVLQVDEKSRQYRFIPTRAVSGAMSADDLFKPRNIHEEVDVEWEVYDAINQEEGAEPKVLITALGEITPFELTLSGDQQDYIVFVNDEGVLEQREKGAFR